jgi:hypothetical protein
MVHAKCADRRRQVVVSEDAAVRAIEMLRRAAPDRGEYVIDRPQLLTVLKRTSYLPRRHPLARWAANETITAQDEFELDQWPARSIDSLLALASDVDGDPYLEAMGTALQVRMPGNGLPFPAGSTVQSVYDATREAAATAVDPLLQMLVANQASSLAQRVTGVAACDFNVLCWQLGCRLTDPDPLYVIFYLSELWDYWNSFPRSYALSHIAIPPAQELLRHLGNLDGGRFEHRRRLLGLKADLELLIAGVQMSDRHTSMQKCLGIRSQIYELLHLVKPRVPDTLGSLRLRDVSPDELWDLCRDLAMTLLYLEQFRLGVELFRTAMLLSGTDDAEDMVETIGVAVSELGLVDAAI